ncbi:MAG: hypothetical protein ACR2JV_07840 [Gaiellales bacterium]
MGILRRSGDADDVEPDGGPDAPGGDAATDEEQGPLGPTGRPLHPVGAYFEAAFRRFGINFGGYLLYTAICGLPTIGAAIIVTHTTLSGEVQGLVLALAYALGFVFLTALTTTLVSGGGRERLTSILVASLLTGVLAGLIVWQLLFLAIVLLPFAMFPPIIAASGDADGARALGAGAVATFRWFRRSYACVFGLIIVAVSLWIGFTGLFFALQGGLGEQLRLALTTLLMWPVSALVFRNLYGDMTGRLVINAPPNEDAQRKALMKARREKSKRNRARIKRVTGEE